MKASAAPPACEVTRDHVYGLRLGEMYSGQALYCLHGGGQGSRERDAGHVIVYGASSLGVVHDLVTNKQIFLISMMMNLLASRSTPAAITFSLVN